MNMLQLLNPADDAPMDSSRVAFHGGCVLVVETQGDDTSAARSLMLLGTKDDEVPAAVAPTLGYKTPHNARGPHHVFARSPILLPSPITSFHMSPMASKNAVPVASMWTTSSTEVPRYENSQDEGVELPAPAPLRRRLSSISSMLNELELPSSCDMLTTPTGSPVIAPSIPTSIMPSRPDYCSVTGCLRRPCLQNQGKCTVHKGMKLCQIDGCFRPVQSRGCCKSHGGGARCKYPECSKGAISKGRCRTHGGGTRCAVPECLKWAQRFGCCVRHSKAVTPKPHLL